MSSILNRFKPLFMSVIVLAGLSQRVMAGDDGGIAAVPAGSAFSFQGKLNQDGQPLTGQAEFAFTLYDAPSSGVLIATATPAMQTAAVTAGLFTTTIDFGTSAFVSQSARWVSVAVRVPPGSGVFTTLTPRQRIAPVPVALFALNGTGLTLPYAGTVSSGTFPAFSVTNTSDKLAIYAEGVFGAIKGVGGFCGAGVIGENMSGESCSSGVIGSVAADGIGVLGNAGTNGVGVRGVNENFTSGQLGRFDYGVYGQHGVSLNRGLLAGVQEGALGRYGAFGNYGQLGTVDYGAYGLHVTAQNHGRLGDVVAGVRGLAAANNSTSAGVRGEQTTSGNYGTLGTSNAGVHGYAGFTGVAGRFESAVANGTGVYCSVPNGKAIHAVNAVSGHAGYFEGFCYFSNNVGLGVLTPSFQLHLSANSAAKPTSNTWTISSDRRLKKNITPLHGSLEQLMQLKGVTYQWIDPAMQGDMRGTYTGMIAQDVERVFPEWVDTDPDGFKTLTVIGFEGLVVEALRDLRLEKDEEIADLDEQLKNKNAQIEHLYAAHAALHSRMEAMERAIQTLSQKH